MPFTTLIDTETLARHLSRDDWALVDCRYKLDEPDWGAREYVAQHIPGAVYADLKQDLSSTPTGANGRHPLPSPGDFARTLGRLGIASDVQVIAYDQDSGMFASRLWWMLRWMGHPQVAVLDGGLAKWLAEGRGTGSGGESRQARTFEGSVQDEMVASTEDVAALVASGGRGLVDARATERYRGDVEPIDRVGGHIPGAMSYPFRENLAEDGHFRSAASLRSRWRDLLGEVPSPSVVAYCGSGVTACHNLLALEHAGLGGGRLYPGSWSEWSSDATRPVARGPAPGGD